MVAPLVDAINELVDDSTYWCTPWKCDHSIIDIKKEISVSDKRFGSPHANTGKFKEATDLAAKAYKSDNTRFVVHGSTGSNFIIMRYLSKLKDNFKLLSTRNIHKSILYACDDYKVDLNFIQPSYDKTFGIFLPPTVHEFETYLKKNEDVDGVLIINPTYQGLSAKLGDMIKIARDSNDDTVFIVDEAWGAHLPFSDELPKSAMELGADISTHSTHKEGGSINQGSMIHWKNYGRVDNELLIENYKEYTTTSPSYIILQSLDLARDFMETHGKGVLHKKIKITEFFKDELKSDAVRVMDELYLDTIDERIDGYDKIKTLINTADCGMYGSTVCDELQFKYNIVPEMANLNGVLFITTYMIEESHAAKTANAIKEILPEVRTPLEGVPIPPTLTERELSYSVAEKSSKRVVKLENALNQICGENIIPYPPGIPLVLKGEVLTRDIWNYLKTIDASEIYTLKESDRGLINVTVS